jgi:hypothetical protein
VKAHQVAAMREVLGPLVEAITPALETTEQVRMNEGRTQAMDILASHKETLGDFDDDRAILSASRYMAQGLEPEAALERAAQEERAVRQGDRGRRVRALPRPGTELGRHVGRAFRRLRGRRGGRRRIPVSPARGSTTRSPSRGRSDAWARGRESQRRRASPSDAVRTN